MGKWHSQRENCVLFSFLWIAICEVGNTTGYFSSMANIESVDHWQVIIVYYFALSDQETMMRDGNYSDLATKSRNYYLYIPCMVQADEIIQEKVLLNVIEAMIDLWLISATPISNRATDIIGYFELFEQLGKPSLWDSENLAPFTGANFTRRSV